VYLSQRRDLLAYVNDNANAVLAFTPGWRDCIIGQGLRLPCFSLPHGFNPNTYFPVPKDLARRFFGLPRDSFLILNLNRNQPRKRWDICLQAFADVVARLPNAPIRLVVGTALTGAWNIPELFERELLKRGVKDAPQVVRDRLVVPGHPQMLTDMETNFLYNVADIGINTCDGEGFGLCNFEQAAIGIPQVVPALGGFLHFFDETCALMVKPKISIYVDTARDGVGGEAELSAPVDFADAIMRYYGDRDLMCRHGASARERIVRDFAWGDIANKLDKIIREDIIGTPQRDDITIARDSCNPVVQEDQAFVSIATLESRILLTNGTTATNDTTGTATNATDRVRIANDTGANSSNIINSNSSDDKTYLCARRSHIAALIQTKKNARKSMLQVIQP
jgi:glycosyltransferase involved in cell wall biosynthesis